MHSISFFEGDQIFLCTQLDESMFAKTKSSLLLDEQGFCVTQDNSGCYTVFTPWKFSRSVYKDGLVYLSENFPHGNTLYELLLQNSSKEDAIFAVCECYANALKNGILLPCNGPHGIIFSKQKILFLPERAVDKCIANCGKLTFEEEQNSWKDSLATEEEKLNFSLALYSYYALTETKPFLPQTTALQTGANISDRNFLPLEYCINGVSQNLASAVNERLLGESKHDFLLAELKAELKIKKEGLTRPAATDEATFHKKVRAFKEKQANTLRRKKAFRKHAMLLLGIAVAAVFITVAVISIIRENGKKPVVIGLSSVDTVRVFYKGIHTMDTDLMLAAAKNCPQAQRYISQVPQIYVTGQMKSAYNFESGISTPENWLYFEPDTSKSYSHFIYGITNFSVDRTPTELNIRVPQKKNHPTRVLFADENKTRIEKAPDASHTVRYFLVHSVDNMIQIEQYTTVVTLKYIKDRWQIIELDQVSSAETISPLPFSLDYKQALADFNHDEIKAAMSLKEKYPWIPTEAAMQTEKKRLDALGY